MDLTTYTDDDLDALRVQVLTEQERRATLASAPQQAAQAQQAYTAALGRQAGSDWAQPAGAHDAYMAADTVTHKGKTWTSLIDWNVHAPGVSGWREQAAEGGHPAWTQPAGAHDVYGPGAVVTHKGKVWDNAHGAGNAWEPGVYGWTATS